MLANDLFAAPPVAGLSYAEALVGAEEQADLIAAVGTLELSPFRFQGWTGKRETLSFGWRYDFEQASFARAAPIPDFLLPLRARAAAFAGFPAEIFEQALIIRYDPGAGIGWHRDRPVFEHVLGISLGAPVTLRLRRRTATGFHRAALPLAPGSVYHLTGEVRHEWEHSIAPVAERRWSVTFRSLSQPGRRYGDKASSAKVASQCSPA